MKTLYRRMMLFFGIVWRESPAGGLMSVKTAWQVAGIIHPIRNRR